MAEVIYYKDGKIPVVSSTYTITDEYFEYKSVAHKFKVDFDDITYYETNYHGDTIKLYIQTEYTNYEAKINQEALTAFINQTDDDI